MSGAEKKIRWWPLIAIAVLEMVALLVINQLETNNQQMTVIYSILAVLVGGFLLLIWFFMFSGLARRTKLTGLAVLVLGLIAFFVMFEVRDFSGNMMPIFGPRWAASYEDLETGLESATASVTVAPEDYVYPRFQGPNQNNTVPGPALASWETRAPIERWRIDIGAGWSAFSIAGKLAVTQEQRGDKEMVTCYDLETGAPVWGYGADTRLTTSLGGDGPRGTPTLHDGKVYAMGGTGILSCVSLTDGSLIWQRNAAEENNAARPEWGYASSPMVLDDLVIVSPGGPDERALVAYNRHDGSFVWGAGIFYAGYASPRLHVLGGVPQIVVLYHNTLAGHDPQTGRVLWQKSWGTGSPTAANPLQLSGDELLVSSGYGVGSARLRITPAGEGWQVETLYESRRLKAKFANYVLYGDHVYGLDDGVLTCIDPENGERVWKGGRYKHGQVLLVGDMLVVQAEKGDLYLVEATPEGHREVGMYPVLDNKAWNHMAISGNLLLVRNHKQAVCLELPTR